MGKYVIEWEEILHRDRIIVAENLEDALKEAERLYSRNVTLSYDNHISTKISALDIDTGEKKIVYRVR